MPVGGFLGHVVETVSLTGGQLYRGVYIMLVQKQRDRGESSSNSPLFRRFIRMPRYWIMHVELCAISETQRDSQQCFRKGEGIYCFRIISTWDFAVV